MNNLGRIRKTSRRGGYFCPTLLFGTLICFMKSPLFRSLLLALPVAALAFTTPAHAQQAAESDAKGKVKEKNPKKPKVSSKDEVVTISTSQGDIRLILFDDTPLHKKNFLEKAKSGFYNGTTFHRVIDNFMIQGGDANSKDSDPNNDGMGKDGDPTVPAELGAGHKHDYGALAAARQGGPAGTPSSYSQFYLVENHGGTHFLDGAYTVYGQTIQGLDVIDKIAKVAKNERDRPTNDVKMTMKVEKLKKKKIAKLYGYKYQ
jgi:cyclophilin family peptidyl-prolyl cis-trans isomerase